MKITIVGTGYVGLSLSVLLSIDNDVIAVDISTEKIRMINNRKSPINDKLIQEYFDNHVLRLTATTDDDMAYKVPDYVIIATPTDYNTLTNQFNTKTVETVIKNVLNQNRETTIVIKSTIPIGFTEKMRKLFNYNKIIFSPEFLREGYSLYDNLYPSRIIIGSESNVAKIFAKLLKKASLKNDVEIIHTDSKEAESVKLFSNTYLAMRVGFFNELDTFCEANNLNTKKIIDGMSLDNRIGKGYNNPSFGYGGYCLPKDTKQLLANYDGLPNSLIKAIVETNNLRKKFISDQIISKGARSVGVYRLIMKSKSDNFRDSSIIDVIKNLNNSGINIYIYEPMIDEDHFLGFKIIKDFDYFKAKSDLIISNRLDNKLNEVKHKIYSRDIYNIDD